MKTYPFSHASVAVIGAGHAGVEAALASARLGVDTALFSLSLDAVGNMPCNPSIGGAGKGHLVYEIDALGGEMGHAADMSMLSSRTLGESGGVSVHSKRVQTDRLFYRSSIKRALEETPNMRLVQAQIASIRLNGQGKVCEIVTTLGAVWSVDAVVIASGTYLRSQVITGESVAASGPDGYSSANALSECLRGLGISLLRFKTGTPPRLHADSIDFSRLERQDGEARITPFSWRTPEDHVRNIERSQKFYPCHIAYTNAQTHEILRSNLHRSPLYTGVIEGIGPRYCPSIEDKIVRFADKERHQLFVEPMGYNTKEIYLQGFSSSLPEDVQLCAVRSIKGLEGAVFMRTAYAIEYDLCDPLQLLPTLGFKAIPNLFGAGQFNGSSGYEEAAAQGIVAGINAALLVKGGEPFILTRENSYIGMLIDDLVTKGTNEPYRVMTSRTEYRMLLRQDNAAYRLSPLAHKIGLVSDERMTFLEAEQAAVAAEVERANNTTVHTPEGEGLRLSHLLRRQVYNYANTVAIDRTRPDLTHAVMLGAEIAIKYETYIARALRDAAEMRRLEDRKLPPDIDYNSINGLRLEARQKLTQIRPTTIGQAARISGVSPADITVLIIGTREYGQGDRS